MELEPQTERVAQTPVTSLESTSNSIQGGMADIGSVASLFYPDAGLYQNPALLSTNHEYFGINISYMPMFLNIAPDIDNKSVNGFYAFDSKNVIAYTYSRFSLGSITLMDQLGYAIATVEPLETYHKFSYSRAISNYVSVGLGIKFIDSDMGLS